jgi:hypothetical protein
MRIAHTRGGKSEWSGWSSSTKGWDNSLAGRSLPRANASHMQRILGNSYHEQRPDGVVEKDGGCCNEHAEAYETVELTWGQFSNSLWNTCIEYTILKEAVRKRTG